MMTSNSENRRTLIERGYTLSTHNFNWRTVTSSRTNHRYSDALLRAIRKSLIQ